eukprot:2867387-Heterocapsa_arctica.AAC.1
MYIHVQLSAKVLTRSAAGGQAQARNEPTRRREPQRQHGCDLWRQAVIDDAAWQYGMRYMRRPADAQNVLADRAEAGGVQRAPQSQQEN